MIAFWCYLGFALIRRPYIKRKIVKYQHVLVPAVLIVLGVAIIAKHYFLWQVRLVSQIRKLILYKTEAISAVDVNGRDERRTICAAVDRLVLLHAPSDFGRVRLSNYVPPCDWFPMCAEPPFSQFEGSFYNDSLGFETLIISWLLWYNFDTKKTSCPKNG